uniref:F-box domain-containing protein n=1 Tax=Lactuca sativa TaxID=4236 RepID=A0A9R1VGW7_LACSA|nr:hypothetical protein LSAT_V11C500256180 [Lactuca sativa]
MTESENQEASSKKSFKTCDNNDPSPWLDHNHELLFTVMMQLGVVDFPAFSGVCKSWRSFAHSNKTKFMESSPIICMSISIESNEEDYNYYLDDINTEGRSFNSILPHSGGRTCVCFTYGHLILFEISDDPEKIRGFLVFSPSKSRWLFIMTNGSANIWYSISGQGEWNHVLSTSPIVDVHAFNGKMYAIDNSSHLCELKINPEPKLSILETKNFPNFPKLQQFYYSGESLYVSRYLPVVGHYEYHKLDFEEMKWVLCKSSRKASSSNNKLKRIAAAKQGKSKLFIWQHMMVMRSTSTGGATYYQFYLFSIWVGVLCSISGQGEWNHVLSTSPIVDVHAFNGKMYAIDNSSHLCELKINPEPKLSILETKNFPNFPKLQQFYYSGESLYVSRYLPVVGHYEYHKLDFEEMKWVLCKSSRKASSSNNKLKRIAAAKQGKSKLFIWQHMMVVCSTSTGGATYYQFYLFSIWVGVLCSISGQGEWNHVLSTSPIVDVHAFNGKMYAIDNSSHLCELKINPEPKLSILETKNFPNFPKLQQFYYSGESLYVSRYLPVVGHYEYHKLDFEEMKWVLCKSSRKASSSNNKLKRIAAAKQGKSKLFIWQHMVYPKIV